MKYILLLISLYSFSFANTIQITKELTSIGTDAHQIIVEDRLKNISAMDILEDRYEMNYFKDRTSPTQSAFWTKTTIRNISKEGMHLYFQNSRAGTDKIDVYIYKEKELISTYVLGDLRDQKLREYLAPKSVFLLELPVRGEYVIITRLESLGPMNFSWHIFKESIFLKKSSLEFLFNGLFAGVLIALIIYNFMLFISLRDISFLLYVLLTVSILWIHYTFSGMFYFMDVGINLNFLSLSAWFVSYAYSGLFILFAISFFKLYEKDRYIFYFFSGLAFLSFILSFLSLYLFVDNSLAIYTPYSYVYLYFSLLAVFIYAVYAAFKGYPFSIYFLLGEGAYLSSFLYSIIVVSGTIQMSSGFQFIVPTAMMLEVIIFSMALSKRVKMLRQSNDEQEVLLLEESKFSAIGKSIGNIAHQWKTPLSQLNTHLLYLHGLYHIGDEKKLINEFGTNIEKIAHIMNYMKDSIDELHDFYSDVDLNQSFKIKKQILLALALQNDKLILNNVDVNVECDDELFLVGAKHCFANILMILFDNSIYQFEKQKRDNARIDIVVLTTENKTEIHFKDNAGGITIEPIEKVFEMLFSTKGYEGSGLGLPLAKKLAKDALHGDIRVSNGKDGAEFIVIV